MVMAFCCDHFLYLLGILLHDMLSNIISYTEGVIMNKIRVYLGVFIMFLILSVDVSASKPCVSDGLTTKSYEIDPQKRDRWSNYLNARYRMIRGLNLSDDQWREIKSLHREHQQDMRILRNKHREAMLNILTPVQKDSLDKKMQELRRYKGHNHSLQFERGDFPDRRIWERNSNNEVPSTNIDVSTWGRLKNIFQ